MGLFAAIRDRLRSGAVDWDDLEATLVGGDLGVRLATGLVERIREGGGASEPEAAVRLCKEEILGILGEAPAPPAPFAGSGGGPTVILVAGVNGVGKTTSIAKLAAWFRDRGDSVVIAAGDTFRAAAIEQLALWGERLGVPVVSTRAGGDPSAACYDAHRQAIESGAGYLICDTAGRLHTRHNLMEEIKKIRRTLSKQDPAAPQERWLVVDATTGANALSQAREFHGALDLTGLIVTKLDGSGKGGGLVAIRHELGVPARFLGTGEKAGDLRPFDPADFVETLL